ncbi:MAG TPA: gamma-glutamyl-gamma-aminobutyrate hydrolase family protein [Thermoanaerobaculia bacterium]|nr:gamma-glutamyl-gamma-aminobutyrate hydrolase family protein [Thermoanaerobaculia bacterium]
MRIALTLDRDADLSETNDYVRSLVEAGVPRESIAVATPLSPEVGPFDALVLGGGVDVDPARYGRPALENGTVEVDADRDTLDFRLLEEARRAGVPVFGICRGLQVVNVALGGTLVQDIPSERPSAVVHQRTKAEKTRLDHRVAIVPGTRLAAIADAPDAAVNSRHHQAIDGVAPGLAVAATAPDGVAEAVEAPGEPWLLAVQWHPENLAKDGLSRRLFAEFLRAARARLAACGGPSGE